MVWMTLALRKNVGSKISQRFDIFSNSYKFIRNIDEYDSNGYIMRAVFWFDL